MMTDLLKALSGGEGVPGTRASISDCILGLLAAIHAEWVLHPEGAIAHEVDNMLSALRNKDDPMLKDLDMMQLQALSTVMTLLKKTRTREAVNATNRPVQSAL